MEPLMTLSTTDITTRRAKELGTLKVEICWSERFQNHYWVIKDDHGLIEIALTKEEADARIKFAQGTV